MARVMIMGGGAAQVPLILKAKELGFETVVASIDGPYPGLALADIVATVDLRDPQAVADAAENLQVTAVAGCGNDMCLPAQAAVCRRLGLPGPSEKAAQASVNKLVMKEAFVSAGVSSAPFAVLRTPEDVTKAGDELGFPLVVKAVDLTGSAGVTIAGTHGEALEAFTLSMQLTDADYCLAEKFIEGQNLGAEAFVQNGSVLFVLPDGTISHSGRTNIPMGHYLPLDVPDDAVGAIVAEVEKAILACDCDNCAVNIDLIWDGTAATVVELSARAGTTCLPELASLYLGVDYYELILMAALGRDAGKLLTTASNNGHAAAALMVAAPATGTISCISLPPDMPAYVKDFHFIVDRGDSVKEFESCRDRIGQLIVVGDSIEECMDRISKCLDAATISVDVSD